MPEMSGTPYSLDQLKKAMRHDRYAKMAPTDMVRKAASVRQRMQERYAHAMRIDPNHWDNGLWNGYHDARDEYIRLVRAYNALCGDLFPWEQIA